MRPKILNLAGEQSTLKNRSAAAFAVAKVRGVRHKAHKELKGEKDDDDEEEEEDEDEVGKNRERIAATRERVSVYWRRKTAVRMTRPRRRSWPSPRKAGEIMPPSWMLVNIPCRKRASSRARDPALGGEVSRCYC